MRYCRQAILAIILAISSLCGERIFADVESFVQIERTDGWLVAGNVHERSDDTTLWLTTLTDQVVLLTAINWSDIRKAQVGGQYIPDDQIRLQLLELATPIPESSIPLPSADPPENSWQSQSFDSRPQLLPIEMTEYVRDSLDERVVSLYIETSVANWDADVESDGLRILVVPLGADGAIVPVDGFLDVRLFGRTISTGGRHHPGSFRLQNLFPQITRWGQKVRRLDFGPDGAIYDLPFRAIHPEFDYNLAIDALVNARLSVAQRGVFEASDANVRLRPYSRFRDFHQQETGRRFLREETTHYRLPAFQSFYRHD